MKNLFWVTIMLSVWACTNDTLPEPEEVSEDAVIWTGANMSFDKVAGADPSVAENQDRLTDNVWITRGNNGGQIYNAVEEDAATKRESPRGTLWAIGTIDEIENLNFANFRSAVGSPKQVVGKDLVLFLREDEIYLSVKFTSWGQNKAGNFSYERSTEN